MTQPIMLAPAKACRQPPTPRLDSITGVRRELARLYREARANSMDVSDASKLANILQILGRMIEGADLERRLGELERRLESKR